MPRSRPRALVTFRSESASIPHALHPSTFPHHRQNENIYSKLMKRSIRNQAHTHTPESEKKRIGVERKEGAGCAASLPRMKKEERMIASKMRNNDPRRRAAREYFMSARESREWPHGRREMRGRKCAHAGELGRGFSHPSAAFSVMQKEGERLTGRSVNIGNFHEKLCLDLER